MGELIFYHICRYIDKTELFMALLGLLFLVVCYICSFIQERKEKFP